MRQLADFVIRRAQTLGCRYDVHQFPSGAVMIDVFDATPSGEMLVFQIEEDRIGISTIGDEVAFTSKPDETFFELPQALAWIEQLLG